MAVPVSYPGVYIQEFAPGAPIQGVRVELVTRYVENRDRSLASVAELLGFSALSAFSRWFRSQFGCSVSEWRTRHD